MKRRGFLAALAALPFLGRIVKAAPEADMCRIAAATPVLWSMFVGCEAALCYTRGMLVDPTTWRPQYMGIVSKAKPWVVTYVDYARGRITVDTGQSA